MTLRGMLGSRWVAAGVGVGAILLARSTLLSWGATAAERHAPLPGDSLLPRADLVATRAVTIEAASQQVWPWLAQLGQGRGGLYTYDFLENLMGCDMHSAERIVPEWQAIQVGDEVRLHPDLGMTIAVVVPGRAVVLRGGVPMGSRPAPFDFTWSFVLDPHSERSTRLVVRERYTYVRPWAALIVEPVEVISFIMSRGMLRGIKARAERSVAATSAP